MFVFLKTASKGGSHQIIFSFHSAHLLIRFVVNVSFMEIMSCPGLAMLRKYTKRKVSILEDNQLSQFSITATGVI